ncbi:uncharacterized protein LOC120431511 [Culex pipiens pallens]|uniref:uncharacterized protein LOC120431511 n=1 Tax=Culex pipiens pallens TaxID=42434 RepID=UPI001954016F|nr:uncharacterized protein LOC120431511 [Culex pipiens pallens]
MDAKQFAKFMASMEKLLGSFKSMAGQAAAGTSTAGGSAIGGSVTIPFIPLPPPLELEGDMERNYNFFENGWKNYTSAVGMDAWPVERNKQKTSVLLSVIGQAALKKYFNFELTEVQQGDPALALSAIKAKVVRERNPIIDWTEFFSMEQWEEESVDDFVGRLKALAKLCKFGVLEAEMVKFKIVTSNKWSHLRATLLTAQNLTEAIVVDLCRAEEVSERHRKAVSSSSVGVNKVRRMARKCKFCGGRHEFVKGVCPALGKKCNRCGGKNHFEKACKNDRKKRSKKKVKDVYGLSGDSAQTSEESDSEPESSDAANIGQIYDKSSYGGHVQADLDLFVGETWQSVQCELDTGANASLVGRDWLIRVGGQNSPQLLPSRCRLQSFGGGHIPVLGEVKIPCHRNGRKYNLSLQVVDVEHGPLLSAQVCKKLGFVKFCNSVSASAPHYPNDLIAIHRIKAQDSQLIDSGKEYRQKDVPSRMQQKPVHVCKQPRKEPQTSKQNLDQSTTQIGKAVVSVADQEAVRVWTNGVRSAEEPNTLKLPVPMEMPNRLKRNSVIPVFEHKVQENFIFV